MDQRLKYSWQQAVLDAFLEFRPEVLPTKINAAERVIAARLRDREKIDFDEHMALTDALHALQVLVPSPDQSKTQLSVKKDIA